MVLSGKILDHSEFNTDQNWIMDTLKIRKNLGYSEKISFDEGLKKTIEWEFKSKYKEEAARKIDYKEEDNIFKNINLVDGHYNIEIK